MEASSLADRSKIKIKNIEKEIKRRKKLGESDYIIKRELQISDFLFNQLSRDKSINQRKKEIKKTVERCKSDSKTIRKRREHKNYFSYANEIERLSKLGYSRFCIKEALDCSNKYINRILNSIEGGSPHITKRERILECKKKNDNLTAKEIAEIVGTSTDYVYSTLTVIKRTTYNEFMETAMANKYDIINDRFYLGLSLQHICQKYKISENALKTVLKEYGAEEEKFNV